MLSSRLTSKYQATIPEKIRKILGLKKGDLIAFKIQRDKVILRKSPPIDLKFAKAIENTLSEWNSESDEEAY